MFKTSLLITCLSITSQVCSQSVKAVKIINVDIGWANNSINTVIFRKNSLCSYQNTQYIAYYDANGFVTLAKRQLGAGKWTIQHTPFKGDVTDAHRSISIITDGDGYLHCCWDHHNNKLNYCRSVAPGSLQMTAATPMTGIAETKVTYPEFYRLANGDLIFLYRDGQSGQGNLVVDHYDTKEKKWRQLQNNLIDGEKKRNAYWQACVDTKGTIHISWVWRESPDVASNHDMCYARSTDGGITWENSKGEKYALPVNAATAEYICRIPQKSELINQTSMYADENGHPFIASYWEDKDDTIPQYHILYNTGTEWKINNVHSRKTTFSLSGAGTKRIPISRPQVISYKKKNTNAVILIFRDEERGNKISCAINKDINSDHWQIKDIAAINVGSWEPTYDTELWKQKKQLHLFMQYTDQKDGEGKADILPQAVRVLEVVLGDR